MGPEHPSSARSDHARDVVTSVEKDRGLYYVRLSVIFPDGVVSQRIQTQYFTHRAAAIAAGWIERAARRDIPGGPLHGF